LKINPFYNKRRNIVQLFKKFRDDPQQPGVWKTKGVSRTDFINHIAVMPLVISIAMRIKWPSKYNWLTATNVVSYVDFVVDDDYLKTTEEGLLKISTKGEQFIARSYYWKKYFGWTPKVLIPFITIPIISFIVIKSAFYFGYRIDEASLYGITATRGPNLAYSYDREGNGIVITWQKGIKIEELGWYLPRNQAGARIKVFGSGDPFLITNKAVNLGLVDWAVNMATKSSPSLSYSRNELLGGIECYVIPDVSEEGIPFGVKIRYFNDGSNEIHELRDLILVRGFGSISPAIEVERNVTYERWKEVFDRESDDIEWRLRQLIENRRGRKDVLGNCLEQGYMMEYNL